MDNYEELLTQIIKILFEHGKIEKILSSIYEPTSPKIDNPDNANYLVQFEAIIIFSEELTPLMKEYLDLIYNYALKNNEFLFTSPIFIEGHYARLYPSDKVDILNSLIEKKKKESLEFYDKYLDSEELFDNKIFYAFLTSVVDKPEYRIMLDEVYDRLLEADSKNTDLSFNAKLFVINYTYFLACECLNIEYDTSLFVCSFEGSNNNTAAGLTYSSEDGYPLFIALSKSYMAKHVDPEISCLTNSMINVCHECFHVRNSKMILEPKKYKDLYFFYHALGDVLVRYSHDTDKPYFNIYKNENNHDSFTFEYDATFFGFDFVRSIYKDRVKDYDLEHFQKSFVFDDLYNYTMYRNIYVYDANKELIPIPFIETYLVEYLCDILKNNPKAFELYPFLSEFVLEDGTFRTTHIIERYLEEYGTSEENTIYDLAFVELLYDPDFEQVLLPRFVDKLHDLTCKILLIGQDKAKKLLDRSKAPADIVTTDIEYTLLGISESVMLNNILEYIGRHEEELLSFESPVLNERLDRFNNTVKEIVDSKDKYAEKVQENISLLRPFDFKTKSNQKKLGDNYNGNV